MDFIIDRETISGHDSYLSIMKMIANSSVDVASDKTFQKLYVGYYFPAQVKQGFKDAYFAYMQQCRSACPSYREILTHLFDITGEVHYSFASKLLHTLNPDNPVLDRHVLRLLGFEQKAGRYIMKDDPNFKSKKNSDAMLRIDYYCSVFDAVSSEYKQYENECFMKEAIKRFDALSQEYSCIPYTKKVDMLLFRLRNGRGVSVLDYLAETK